MYTQDDVKRLISDIGELKLDPGVEFEVTMFGMSAVLFDPITGTVSTLAQPQRAEPGQSEVFYTALQVVNSVRAARVAHMHALRAAGYFSLDDYNAAQKRRAELVDLQHKQDLELIAMNEAHSEATAKAAADGMPQRQPDPIREEMRDERVAGQ
jgi:hypothetical protein